MAIDPDRFAPAAAAGLASAATSLLVQVSAWFGVPPPTRREVLRGLAETVGGVFLAYLFGYGFGAAMAQALTGVAAFAHLHVTVDPLAGGLVIGATVLKGLPLLVDLSLARARKMLGAKDAEASKADVA